jgi:hypothetical protein
VEKVKEVLRAEEAGGHTRGSECSRLSEREVNKVRKWVTEKERKKRRNNIVIKGLGGKIREVEENKVEWVENFTEKKLGIECKIKMCRINKAIVIAKVEGEEKKWEIMVS